MNRITNILNKDMLSNDKVKNMPRQIERTDDEDENSSKQILIVSGSGTDDKIVNSLMSHEDDILKTNSF